jgi:hypothetical protein
MLFKKAGFCIGSFPTCSGKWLTPFDSAFTEADTFHLDKYKAVKVPMMYRAGHFASTFDKNFRCHILKLPYRGNATMLVVLMERTGDHLALEDYLTSDLVQTWLRNMKTRYDPPPLVQTLPTISSNTLWLNAISPRHLRHGSQGLACPFIYSAST